MLRRMARAARIAAPARPASPGYRPARRSPDTPSASWLAAAALPAPQPPSPGPVAAAIRRPRPALAAQCPRRSEEHTSELQSLMRISYAVFCLKKKQYNIHFLTHTDIYDSVIKTSMYQTI